MEMKTPMDLPMDFTPDLHMILYYEDHAPVMILEIRWDTSPGLEEDSPQGLVSPDSLVLPGELPGRH